MTDKWRPIRTARKVFSKPLLLAYRNDRGGWIVAEGAWGLGRYSRSKRDYEHTWTIGTQMTVEPEFWQPMPKPPAVKAKRPKQED